MEETRSEGAGTEEVEKSEMEVRKREGGSP